MQKADMTAAAYVAFKHWTGKTLTIDKYGHHYPKGTTPHVQHKTALLRSILLDALGIAPGLTADLAGERSGHSWQMKKVGEELSGDRILLLVEEFIAFRRTLS